MMSNHAREEEEEEVSGIPGTCNPSSAKPVFGHSSP